MDIIKKIKNMISHRIDTGPHSIENLVLVCLNPPDWEEYLTYKKSIGCEDYTIYGAKVKMTNSSGKSRCFFNSPSNPHRKLGVIGTAGRNDDLKKLDSDTWKFMKSSVAKLVETTGCDILVSGGAAWSDHLAVDLYLKNSAHLGVNLHLPCTFSEGQFDPTHPCGKVLNRHHKNFSEKLGVDTLLQIGEAISLGSNVTVSDSFMDRNTKIAKDSDVLLAFTYGNGKDLKKGGTHDTFEKFISKDDRGLAFHLNLYEKKIYVF
jgi:hypothetical protein